MKLSAPAAILWITLLGALTSASADGGGSREKRVEKSDVRTRSKDVEARERHRMKLEKRTDRDDGRNHSERDGHDHSGHDDASRSGSNRGPG